MRIWKILLIIIVSFITFINGYVFALDSNESLEDLDVANFVKKRRISPFEMSSISFSRFGHKYSIVEKATGNKVFKKNGKFTNYSIYIEKPVYDKYISYGIDFGLNLGVKPFTATSLDTALSLKLKAPVYLGDVGDIALTLSGGFGVSTFLGGHSGTPILKIDRNSNRKHAESKKIELRLGSVKILKYGIDYFPVKWLGLSLEWQSRFYNYGKSQFKKSDYILYSGFKYNVKNQITLGIKTTF
jgi:hypothetical protein